MLITLEQAASRAGRSLSTVRRWIVRGELRTWRQLGRTLVREDDVGRLCSPVSSTNERRPGQGGVQEVVDGSDNPTGER